MSLVLDSSLQDYPFWEDLQVHLETPERKTLKTEAHVVLSYSNGALQLDSKLFPKVFCDFLDDKYLKEVKQTYGRSEGVYSFLSKKNKVKVCDLTVGLGKDLFKFVLAGHEVVGFERDPLFYHMVLDGIRRFKESSKTQGLKELFKVEDFKVTLKFGDAKSSVGDLYDLVYFDPMFEDASKKAAPKKGMQALKELVPLSGDEEKFKVIESWKVNSKKFVYKCSGKPKDFPFSVKQELKGKGFSYLVL